MIWRAGRAPGRMAIGDRLRTIAATALVTSIGWIVFGGFLSDTTRSFAAPGGATGRTLAAPAQPKLIAQGSPAPASAKAAPPAPAAGAAMLIPVAGVRPGDLSDTFTAARGGGSRVHDAIDIMAPRGAPVIAAAEGSVEKLFTSRQGGLTIYIRSPDRRTITYYAHLDAYAPGLAEGQPIARGARLGTVGYTGNADPAAPHLHFAVFETTPQAKWWEPAKAINPYPLLVGRGQ
ncbi:M23 family metallopeptidase [Qipengyuania sediminis]|uniref:M23 family metallopeptidase n=1 Tax=Qipengyuania sediminis TaxID=1532023 RepID=UPI001F110BB2|nr:M23 family metallopeptidase [Qipengyuania sediminis]